MERLNDAEAETYGKKDDNIHALTNYRIIEGNAFFVDETVAVGVPLFIRFIDSRAEIPLNELFEKLCKIIQPLLKDENSRKEFELALNWNPKDIELIISGYIRLEIEQSFESDLMMPIELRIWIMGYTKFEIKQELPFELRLQRIFGNKMSIENDADKMVTFVEIYERLHVIWNDESKMNSEYCKRKNRLPVDVDSFG